MLEFLQTRDPVLYFLGLSSALKWYYIWSWNRKQYVGRVSQLFIYPVKSMAGISVTSMECNYNGAKDGQLVDRYVINLANITNHCINCYTIISSNKDGQEIFIFHHEHFPCQLPSL